MALLKYLLVIGVVIVNHAVCRSSTPLIKKIHSGGIHYEGPHWSATENALYWVDIVGQEALRMDEESGNITSRKFAYGPVSLIVTVKDYPNIVALALRSEIYILNWDSNEGDSSLRLLSVVDLGKPGNRCNDGKVDAKGRLWFGTMGNEVGNVLDKDQGTLYVMDAYNHPHPEDMVRPVSVSNGIAWTADSKFMFYIDTPTRKIDVFDFDLEERTIRNRRTLFNFKDNNITGLPDGMTIDSDGNLWVACYDGGKVIKIDSRAGKLLEQHSIGVSKVTSVMWGGRDLSTLYVTTSKRGLSAGELVKQPDAGSLFAIEGTGSKGLPENQFYFPYADKY